MKYRTGVGGLLLLVLARESVISLKKTQSATQMLRLLSMDHGSGSKTIYTPSVTPTPPQSPTNGDLFEKENNIILGEWGREDSLSPFCNR